MDSLVLVTPGHAHSVLQMTIRIAIAMGAPWIGVVIRSPVEWQAAGPAPCLEAEGKTIQSASCSVWRASQSAR